MPQIPFTFYVPYLEPSITLRSPDSFSGNYYLEIIIGTLGILIPTGFSLPLYFFQ